MSKHEKVVDEIKQNLEALWTKMGVDDADKKLLDILRKHYDPEPVLKRGMWVDGVNNYLLLLLEEKGSFWETVEVSGRQHASGIKTITPHTFVEKDLELLNTDEVTFGLHKAGDGGFYVRKTKNFVKTYQGKHDIEVGFPHPTVHEAIKNVFNTVTAINYFKENVLKGGSDE